MKGLSRRLTPALLGCALLLAAVPLKNGYYTDWDNEYPTSQSDDHVINGTSSS